MIKYQTEYIATQKETTITCDVCGKVCRCDYGSSTMDAEEFLSIAFTGGYGSIFGDGTKVKADLCQECVSSVLGKYLRLE